jgi:hypothetical protein
VVTAIDIYCAGKLSRKRVGSSTDNRQQYDYSDRTGLPRRSQPIEEESTPHVRSETAVHEVN